MAKMALSPFAILLKSFLDSALEAELDSNLDTEERLSCNRKNGKISKVDILEDADRSHIDFVISASKPNMPGKYFKAMILIHLF